MASVNVIEVTPVGTSHNLGGSVRNNHLDSSLTVSRVNVETLRIPQVVSRRPSSYDGTIGSSMSPPRVGLPSIHETHNLTLHVTVPEAPPTTTPREMQTPPSRGAISAPIRPIRVRTRPPPVTRNNADVDPLAQSANHDMVRLTDGTIVAQRERTALLSQARSSTQLATVTIPAELLSGFIADVRNCVRALRTAVDAAPPDDHGAVGRSLAGVVAAATASAAYTAAAGGGGGYGAHHGGGVHSNTPAMAAATAAAAAASLGPLSWWHEAPPIAAIGGAGGNGGGGGGRRTSLNSGNSGASLGGLADVAAAAAAGGAPGFGGLGLGGSVGSGGYASVPSSARGLSVSVSAGDTAAAAAGVSAGGGGGFGSSSGGGGGNSARRKSVVPGLPVGGASGAVGSMGISAPAGSGSGSARGRRLSIGVHAGGVATGGAGGAGFGPAAAAAAAAAATAAAAGAAMGGVPWEPTVGGAGSVGSAAYSRPGTAAAYGGGGGGGGGGSGVDYATAVGVSVRAARHQIASLRRAVDGAMAVCDALEGAVADADAELGQRVRGLV